MRPGKRHTRRRDHGPDDGYQVHLQTFQLTDSQIRKGLVKCRTDPVLELEKTYSAVNIGSSANYIPLKFNTYWTLRSRWLIVYCLAVRQL
jgi:hypothetical protein